MTKEYFMGMDIGTSGVRAALFDSNGNQSAISHKEYAMLYDESGKAELNPDEVFECFMQVSRTCMEQAGIKTSQLAAIGLSTQMHSIMAIDSKGNCLTNVITWADQRAREQAGRIQNEFDCKALYELTGCRAQHPMYPLAKVLRIKEELPEVFTGASRFITIKGYILYKLFNEHIIDVSDASATAMMNTRSFKWENSILDGILQLEPGRLGTIVPCTHKLKGIKPEYAAKLGVDPQTPVIIGSSDGVMANLGCGVFDSSSMSCTLGTSGAVRVASEVPLLDRLQRTWCYCFTEDTWVAGGAINNGGIVLKWIRDEFRKQFEAEVGDNRLKSIYELFDNYAKEINPGSDGLIFLPYLTGERSPNWNSDASGTLHGLRLVHGRRHLVRAAMEGVMFRLNSVYKAIAEAGGSSVSRIICNGGYVKSDVWLQMQADIFGKELYVAGVAEASAFGAAYTAMVAVGELQDFRQQLPAMKPVKEIKPDDRNVEIYSKICTQYDDLYKKLWQ